MREPALRAGRPHLPARLQHSSAKTITHHKGDHNPPLRLRSDCSTGLVLDVLAAAAGGGRDGAAVAPWLRLPLTSVNREWVCGGMRGGCRRLSHRVQPNSMMRPA